MDIQELREKTQKRYLFKGKSGRGKTLQSCRVALKILSAGGEVLYVDTESEGSATMLNVIEDENYPDDVVEGLDYTRTEGYSDLMESISNAEDYNLLVLDTLDHKHSYVLKEVADAKRDNGADWNEYPQIYGEEKEMMRSLGSISTNLIATLDPESGSSDKPKGAQTNIEGYFTTVVELRKQGEQEWGHKIINWLGHSEWIGKQHPKFPDPVVGEIKESEGL